MNGDRELFSIGRLANFFSLSSYLHSDYDFPWDGYAGYDSTGGALQCTKWVPMFSSSVS